METVRKSWQKPCTVEYWINVFFKKIFKIKETKMCESNVYIKTQDSEKLIMENVAAISPIGKDKFLLKGLLGESKEISGTIVDINLMGHKIILKEV